MAGYARSVGSVVAGLALVVVLSTATDLALTPTGLVPTNGEPLTAAGAVAALTHRTLWGVLGGWVTARLAPTRPMAHALVLGVLGLALASIGLAVAWDRPELGPVWYPAALVVAAIPQVWVGGKLAEARSA